MADKSVPNYMVNRWQESMAVAAEGGGVDGDVDVDAGDSLLSHAKLIVHVFMCEKKKTTATCNLGFPVNVPIIIIV